MASDFALHLSKDGVSLVPLSDSDLPDVVRQLSDPRVAQWLATVAHLFSQSDAEALLEHARHSADHVRVIKANGAMVGCLSIGTNLWYWMAPESQRRGLMTTALRLALTEWFAGPVPPLVATCRNDNHASRALLVRLGFSQRPDTRRMYFQSIARACQCRDYIMAPEQWHLLNPPRIGFGSVHLRPASQKDATSLSRMPRHPRFAWPRDGDIVRFIEIHRFRDARSGLFAIEDDTRRIVGMALITENQPPTIAFLSDFDASRHACDVEAALANGLHTLLRNERATPISSE